MRCGIWISDYSISFDTRECFSNVQCHLQCVSYKSPTEEEKPFLKNQAWHTTSVRESQYTLQAIKCKDCSCCDEPTSPWSRIAFYIHHSLFCRHKMPWKILLFPGKFTTLHKMASLVKQTMPGSLRCSYRYFSGMTLFHLV